MCVTGETDVPRCGYGPDNSVACANPDNLVVMERELFVMSGRIPETRGAITQG
jgi:hypothetical protein